MLTSRLLVGGALGAAVVAMAMAVPGAFAQDRDHDRDNRDRDRIRRIEPGTRIDVRTTEPIRVDRDDFDRNNRIYHGIVEHDVIGEHDRVAIRRGANVDLRVRVAPDNDLILDLESVLVDGQRYSIESNADRVESEKDHSVVGSIISVLGGQVRGRAVRVDRDTVLGFRLERPLVIREERREERHDDR